jgi:PAS domain S-box-containing protein
MSPVTLYSEHVDRTTMRGPVRMRGGRVFVATEIASPRARLVAVIGAVAAASLVVLLQSHIEWQGSRTEFILLSGFNAFLASLAAWFFHIRWRLLGDPFDRQVQNVFLPIACHFVLLVVLEASIESEPLRDTLIVLSWVITQTLAAAILIYTFRGGRALDSTRRALRTTGAVTLALIVWAIFHYLRSHNVVLGIGPLEAGLATVFLLAAVVPMIGGGDQRQPREVWLGAAFLLTSIAHIDLSWSRELYDGPFMWGYVLLGLSLATPTIGAVLENVTLLEMQTGLSDRLKRLRSRMEILLDSLPVLVISVDRDRNIRYANLAASSLFSVPHGTGVGNHGRLWLERIHDNHRPQVYAAIPAVLEGKHQTWNEVIRVEDDEGRIHWLSTLMHPVVDPVVNETLIQVMATDITDLHVARRAAEARQTRLAFLSNLAQTLAGEVEEQFILDRFLEMSRELLPLRSVLLYGPVATGNALRLVAGAGPGIEAFERDRFHTIKPGDHPCWTTFSEGIPQTTLVGTVIADEIAEWLIAKHDITHLSYLPLVAGGRSAGVLLATSAIPLDLAVDDVDLLTQIGYLLGGAISLSHLVRELDEQRSVAFEASRLKSEFLANTSHELRTPLTAILGFLRLIMDGSVEDPVKQKEFLKIAHEAAENLLNIINDVLDLAKIEAGRLEVHFAPVPARTVLEEARTLFKHQMKSKGLNFHIQGADTKLVIWTDPDRTSQILTNLLSNAIKFTNRGGSITLSCKKSDHGVLFSVQDTGVGIPKDELQKIFSSFYQVDGSTTRQQGGTGLGLTISRRLAEMVGGTLELESEGPGRGVTANLVLDEFTTDHEATNPELRVPT